MKKTLKYIKVCSGGPAPNKASIGFLHFQFLFTISSYLSLFLFTEQFFPDVFENSVCSFYSHWPPGLEQNLEDYKTCNSFEFVEQWPL